MEKKFYGEGRKHFSIKQKIDMRLWFLYPPVLFSKSARIFILRDFFGKTQSKIPTVYAGHSLPSREVGNDLIKSLLLNSDSPMCFGRFGDTELFACADYCIRKKIADQNFWRLCSNAGYFESDATRIDEFVNLYMNAFKATDVLGCWFTIGEDYLLKKYNPGAKLVQLQSYEPYYFPDNPWSESLKGKSVLVVSPFVESIIQQYRIRDKLFLGTEVLPAFDLKTVKAVQTRGKATDTRFSSWFDAFDYMKNEISKKTFDMAIVGCGAYSLPLCAFIKDKLKRSVIQMGGQRKFSSV